MDHSISMLPMLFNILRKKMIIEHQKLMESHELTRRHIPYLMILFNHKEGLLQQEIVDKVHMDKAHASRSLKELLLREFIIKEDKKGYNKKYFLSDKGIDLTLKMKTQSQSIHEEVFSILDDEERTQFEDIIKRLTDHIENK